MVARDCDRAATGEGLRVAARARDLTGLSFMNQIAATQ